jgi:hypothetical protein
MPLPLTSDSMLPLLLAARDAHGKAEPKKGGTNDRHSQW